MPTISDWGFCGPMSERISKVFDASLCINLYPEPGYATSKSQMALVGTPGLGAFATGLGGGSLRPGGLWAGNSRLFACAGDHVYEIGAGGAVVTDFGAMAGSSGTGPVQFASNGSQLLIMDSSIVTAGQQITGAIFNVTPGMAQVFKGGALTYLDGFHVAVASGNVPADNTINQVNVSSLLDGTTWPALNFIQRTGSSDLVTNVETLNGQLFIFGQKTIEPWYNAGNPGFPFARVPGGTINLGLLAFATVVKFQNTIMFWGSDDRGYAVVYRMNGLQPERVSTFAVENRWNQYHADRIYKAFAFGYQQAGHTFYCMTIPNEPSVGGGETWCYDLTTNMWHQRAYNDVAGGVQGAMLANCSASLSQFGANQNQVYVGDRLSGSIYRLGLNLTSDNGVAIVRRRRAPHVGAQNRVVKYPSLTLDCDIGTAQAVLSVSNDGGKTFPSGLVRAAQAVSGDTGFQGGFGRMIWRQLGRSRDRVFDVTISDTANQITLINAYLNAIAGTEE